MVTLTVFTTTFVESGEDFVEDKASGPVRHEFEADKYDAENGLTTLDLVIMFLNKQNVTEPSSCPWGGNEMHVWFSCETYVHPYKGEREETTIHFGDGWDIESRRAVLREIFPQWESN